VKLACPVLSPLRRQQKKKKPTKKISKNVLLTSLEKKKTRKMFIYSYCFCIENN